MEQEGTLSDEVDIVWEFAFLGDRVSGGGGCCNCQKMMWVG